MSLELLTISLILITLGSVAGFLAGLLGIGGGAIVVPGIYYLLLYSGYTENAMHVAVGTSLMTIIFTGASAALSHYKKGAVEKNIFLKFLPGVLLGAVIGTYLANITSRDGLKIIFALSQLFFGSYMICRIHKTNIFKALPSQPFFTFISTCNACLATLMGVGGGVQNVTFMTICSVDIKKAIATASALGPFIAITGAVGFFYIGLDAQNLPPLSFGYLNIPIFLCLVVSSVLSAPLGVRAVHALPTIKVKRFFAIFMLLVSVKMLLEI